MDILSFCKTVLKDPLLYRFAMNPYFPLTFWILNVLELEKRGVFVGRSPRWVRSFLYRHLHTRLSCFVTVYKRLYPVSILSVTRGLCIDRIGGGYCNHCGQCCFFYGGLGNFPEPWPFPDRWKRFFTEGLGRHHLFCAFLWEWRRSGKSFCSIYPWRPIVCDIFGEEECRYYLQAPHLPYFHLDRALCFIKKHLRLKSPGRKPEG